MINGLILLSNIQQIQTRYFNLFAAMNLSQHFVQKLAQNLNGCMGLIDPVWCFYDMCSRHMLDSGSGIRVVEPTMISTL